MHCLVPFGDTNGAKDHLLKKIEIMFSELRGSNKRKKNILLIAGFLLVGMSLKAQGVKPLTLQEAITLSLDNSHKLKASGARTEQANAAVQEAQDNRLPNAHLSSIRFYFF